LGQPEHNAAGASCIGAAGIIAVCGGGGAIL